MPGITDNASTDLLIFIVLKTKYVPSCKREASQCLTDLLKYCVAYTNRSLCFHQIPSEGSSVCTFITLGLHEEFSIRSGSNKSSLTGEMVHQRKQIQNKSIVIISRFDFPSQKNTNRRCNFQSHETCFHLTK